MAKTKAKPLPKTVREMMAEKSAVLTKARAFEDVGMSETALPLWLDAAQHEEKLAPVLEALGRQREAALHRVSAASCFQKGHDFGRAANLFRAALGGALRQDTPREVERMLARCLREAGRTTKTRNGTRAAVREGCTKCGGVGKNPVLLAKSGQRGSFHLLNSS